MPTIAIPTLCLWCALLAAAAAPAASAGEDLVSAGFRLELRFGGEANRPWSLTFQSDPFLAERVDIQRALPFAFTDPLYADYARSALQNRAFTSPLLKMSWLPQGGALAVYEWHLPWSAGSVASLHPVSATGRALSTGAAVMGESVVSAWGGSVRLFEPRRPEAQ